MEKKCAKCLKIKPINYYNKLSRSSDGLNYRCKQCCNEYYNSLYPKIRDNKIKAAKKRYEQFRDDLIAKAKIRYDSSKKKLYNASYNKNNKDRISKQKNEYEKRRVKQDPHYRIIKLMRSMVYRLVVNKKDSTQSILGYSKSTLLNYLGRLPKNDESLDHKIPVSWFVKDAPIHIVSHYKNIQILSKSENSKKSNLYCCSVDYDYYLIAIPYIKQQHKTKIKHGNTK